MIHIKQLIDKCSNMLQNKLNTKRQLQPMNVAHVKHQSQKSIAIHSRPNRQRKCESPIKQ